MRYWPLSILAQSPLMPSAYGPELRSFYHRLPSEPTFHACLNVARETPYVPMSGLIVVQTVNSPSRFAYVGRPTRAEWERLERAAAVQFENGDMALLIDALH